MSTKWKSLDTAPVDEYVMLYVRHGERTGFQTFRVVTAKKKPGVRESWVETRDGLDPYPIWVEVVGIPLAWRSLIKMPPHSLRRQGVLEKAESGPKPVRATPAPNIEEPGDAWRPVATVPKRTYVLVARIPVYIARVFDVEWEYLTATYDPEYRGWVDSSNTRLTDSGEDPLFWQHLPDPPMEKHDAQVEAD